MSEGHLSRVLRRTDVLALSFGAIVGWSWVLLTGPWIERAGSLGAITAFLIGGLCVALLGLVYAELCAAMPQAGGEHVYSLRALGTTGSFVCTWALLLAYASVVMFEAVALPLGLSYLVPGFDRGLLWRIRGFDVHATWVASGAGTALLVVVINVLGVRPVAVLQKAVTLLILAAGLMFLTGAFARGAAANLPPWFEAGAAGVAAVLVMTPTMFVGFDVIPQAAEEIDLPFALIGRLLVFSVLLAVGWYALVILGVGLAFPAGARAGLALPTADAAAAVWDSALAGRLMVLAGIAGIVTSWNAFVVGASRALYALAHSGMVPRWFAAIHPRHGTPHRAVIAVGALACISPFFGRPILIWLIDAGSAALVVAYGLVAVSFIVLRRREPGMPRPFRVPGGEAVGWAALALSGGMLLLYLPGSPSALTWPEWLIAGTWALAGAALYLASPARRCGAGSG